MINSKHIQWIDGLKGCCCILIFIHHYLLFFFPATFYGDAVIEHSDSGIELALAHSPFSFIFNGNYLLCIFLILMTLVITIQWHKTDNSKARGLIIVKKLPVLSVPLFVVSLITWIMMKNGVIDYESNYIISGSPWAEGRFVGEYSLLYVIKSSFVHVWLKGTSPFSTAFWMLNYIFIGSILTYVYILVSKDMNWGGRIILLIAITISLLVENDLLLYLCIPIGVYIGYFLQEGKLLQNGWFSIVFLLAGCILGGYPTGVSPYGIYKIFSSLGIIGTHCIGAGLTIIGVASSNTRLFENPVTTFLGKISYSIYLIHIPLLFSFTQAAFRKIYNGNNYIISAWISLVLSMLVLIIISYAFTKIVILPSKRIINKGMSYMYKNT